MIFQIVLKLLQNVHCLEWVLNQVHKCKELESNQGASSACFIFFCLAFTDADLQISLVDAELFVD